MLRAIMLAIALTLPLVSPATAQGFDWRTALTQSVKVQMKINSEFEFSKKRRIAIHFTMGIPFSAQKPGELVTRTRFPEDQGNVGEMMFLTPDNTLLEFVTISVGTVGGDTIDDKMNRIYSVISKQVYPSLTPPPNANILGGRKTEIAGRPAVEFVSLFDNPDQGPVAARITGVLAPNNKDVIFLVQQVLRDRMGLNGPDELADTFGAAMLSSLTFQAFRDASGKLTNF